MTDLSSLSDAELQAMYQPQASPTNRPRVYITKPSSVSDMSDEQLQAAYGANETSTLADVAKSAGTGLVKGAIGLAGLPGDLTELGARGLDYATRKVGGLMGQDFAPRPEQDTLGSAHIQRTLEGVTGPLYQPKTTAGEYAQTAGEFLPSMLGGPESVLTKLATRVAAPAALSEGAGQLTKGTGAEPFARFAGAVAGGAGAARAMAPKSVAPTVEALGDAATAAYQHPTVAALELHPSSVAYTAGKITDGLNKKGFRELTAPQTYGIVQELKTPLGPTAKIADVQSVRSALGKVAGNFNNPTEQAAANKAIRGIDDYLSNLKPFDVAKGNAAEAASILSDAKGNYAAMSRSQRFDNAEYRAELNAASAHSGGNINNATRQALKSILLSPSKRRGFSAEEIAQMEKVVKGTATGNVMRTVGKLLATSGMHGAGVMGASIAAAPHTGGLSLAIPAAGFAAKKIGNASTANAIRKLDDMIAMRSPLGRSLPQLPASTGPLNAGLLSGLLEYQGRR